MCYPLKELMSVTPGEGGLQKVYIYVLLFLSVFCLLGIAVITLDRGESTGSASSASPRTAQTNGRGHPCPGSELIADR